MFNGDSLHFLDYIRAIAAHIYIRFIALRAKRVRRISGEELSFLLVFFVLKSKKIKGAKGRKYRP